MPLNHGMIRLAVPIVLFDSLFLKCFHTPLCPNPSPSLKAISMLLQRMLGSQFYFIKPLTLAMIGFSIAMPTMAFADDAESDADTPTLTIGSKAPSIDVEHWISNGNGKFKPVSTFEKDHVYVVEFWATWCGPCVASMPHLSELQKKYASKKVQVISISDEEIETVKEFLQRDVPAKKQNRAEADEAEGKSTEDAKSEEGATKDEKITFGQLTSAYCLTTDPDRSVATDYMEAAGQNGIPTAFIVGKQGLIEWIGHPMTMDEPLSQITEDSWNRDAFMKKFKEEQELDLKQKKLMTLLRAGKFEKALSLIDEITKESDEPMKTIQFRLLKVQIYMSLKEDAKVVSAFQEAMDSVKDQPATVNQICWMINQMHEGGQLKNTELVKTAAIATEKAAAKVEGQERAAILSTASHLQMASGNKDKAIELIKQAITLGEGEMKESLTAYLEKLQDSENSKSEDK